MVRLLLPGLTATLVAATMCLTSANGSETVTVPPAEMNCDIGPLGKTFGNAPWNVYSCEDNATLQIVATPLNAAAPFSFTLAPTVHGYRVTANRPLNEETRKAYSQIRGLSNRDISALIAITHHHESLESSETAHTQEVARVVTIPAD